MKQLTHVFVDFFAENHRRSIVNSSFLLLLLLFLYRPQLRRACLLPQSDWAAPERHLLADDQSPLSSRHSFPSLCHAREFVHLPFCSCTKKSELKTENTSGVWAKPHLHFIYYLFLQPTAGSVWQHDRKLLEKGLGWIHLLQRLTRARARPDFWWVTSLMMVMVRIIMFFLFIKLIFRHLCVYK